MLNYYKKKFINLFPESAIKHEITECVSNRFCTANENILANIQISVLSYAIFSLCYLTFRLSSTDNFS